jgi:hypothetical protein
MNLTFIDVEFKLVLWEFKAEMLELNWITNKLN